MVWEAKLMSGTSADRARIMCYVINLAPSLERMSRMRTIFHSLGLSLERIEAQVGSQSMANPLSQLMPPKKDREWSPSELGCLLSHINAWTRIADGEFDHGAIFEDDVYVDPRLKLLCEAGVPAFADILKIETVLQPTRVGFFSRAHVGDVAIAPLKSLHLGGGAYILSKKAAKTLLGRIDTFDMPVDHLLFEPDHPASRDLDKFQTIPALAVQDVVLPNKIRRGAFLSTTMTDRMVFHGAEPETASRPSSKRRDTFLIRGRRFLRRVLTSRQLVVRFGGDLQTREHSLDEE